MSISALPAATVRAIGSTQVLTDACSVVKELVDNSLDARASSVSVEISVNTLDIIRVTDNGHGIAPIDRGLICRRNCTSKITSFEDISSIGGHFLGFRGEALASMAELSGGVTIITRIEGEATATQMEMNRLGELLTQKQVSNAIGTTVCAKDFLKASPVRREAALKGLNNMYVKIKTTLQAYALTRPLVRFSLKVLKAKNEKANCIYSPAPGMSLSKAALRVLDQNAVKQCDIQTWPPLVSESAAGNPIEDESREHPVTSDDFRIEALVPRVDCDFTAINHVGQFISVDSRPVSCARGTFKSLKILFRKYLQNAISSKNPPKLVDPILVFNIQCSPGAYDPNVEPAKDDVLFGDEASFLQLAEALFKQVYGERQCELHGSRKSASDLGQSGFDLLLSRRLKPESSKPIEFQPIQSGASVATVRSTENFDAMESQKIKGLFNDNSRPSRYLPIRQDEHRKSHSRDSQASRPSPSPSNDVDSQKHQPTSPAGKPNMYADDDDLFFPLDDSPLPPDDEPETAPKSTQVLNPWIVAKMNAPIRRKVPSEADGEVPASFINQLPTPRKRQGEAFVTDTPNTRSKNPPRQHQTSLPTPSRSKPRHSDDSMPSESSPLQQRQRFKGSGWMDDFVRQQNDVPQSLVQEVAGSASTKQRAPQKSCLNQTKFVSARTLPLELNIPSSCQPHPDLPLALDFEHRKSRAASQHRAQQRLFQQRPAHANPQHRQWNLAQDVRSMSPTSSPHANRYAKAVAALHANLEDTPLSDKLPNDPRTREIILDPTDARARLMRLQEQQEAGKITDPAVQKLKRVKTSMLPFENVPAGEELFALSCVIDTSPTAITNAASLLGICEVEESEFATPGFFDVDVDTLGCWEAKIKNAIQDLHESKMRDNKSEVDDIEIDLQMLLCVTAISHL